MIVCFRADFFILAILFSLIIPEKKKYLRKIIQKQ